MSPLQDHEKTTFWSDIRKLYLYLSPRRKFQLVILFTLQSFSAISEVVSLGAVIPFLSALININDLIKNPKIAFLLKWTSITNPNDLIMLMAAIFALAIIVANILRFATLWAQSYLSSSIGTDYGRMMFQRTLYRPYSFFTKNNSSHLISYITNDLSGTLGVVQNIFTIITQCLITITVSAGLVVYNPSVAFILSGIIVVAFSLLTVFIRKRLYINGAVISDNQRRMIKILQESFAGVRYIAINRTHKNFVRQYEASDRAYRVKSAENSVVRQAPRFFIEAIGVTAISVLAMLFVTQGKDLKQVVPFLGFLALGCYRLLPAVQQVYSSVTTLMGLKVSTRRTIEVLEGDIAPALLTIPDKILSIKKSIVFDAISFNYGEPEAPLEEWTLRHLSFSIHAKTTVAFVGPTGSGKSTLSDIILGLIVPQRGAVKIDGTILSEDNLGEWQAGISHVPQHIFLMDCSIAENIAFGIDKKDIDMVKVTKAAELAKIDQFIETLPDAYDQQVGERGVRLSGGQLQRIGIARALYNEPSLIVFDEATSALDNKTEQDVMNSIDELSHDITIILIAHRLSTVRKADRIFVFDAGRLVDQGTYEELLMNSPHFQKLALEFSHEKAA